MIVLIATLGLILLAYLCLCAGLYLGQQPFGMTLLAKIGAPLMRAKRMVVGSDPIFVDYSAVSVDDALFDGAVTPGFDGLVLSIPNLAAALPADVSPRAGAPSLPRLLTESATRCLSGNASDYRTIAAAGGLVRHMFDFTWAQPEFLSSERELGECVSIIVPGSGFDLASQIVGRTGYHEDLIDQFPGTRLVYVRPNNDSRQIVYGGKRANFEYMFTTLIGINSIYSYWFLQELIEVVMHLRALGKTVVVGGLSQGGGTALLVGAATEAELTVVLSGYYDPSHGLLGNYHQILVPGLWPFMQPDRLAPLFRGRRLICSYGLKDLPVYRHEAEHQVVSRRMAAQIDKFQVIVHPGGHIHPRNLKTAVAEMLAS